MIKHLCRCLESQPFTGAVIQPVFDHFNFLVSDIRHRAFLGHILPQQPVEVLVGATLPACKGPSEVARATQRLVYPGVAAKLFAVVIGQGFDPGLEGLERADDRGAYQVRGLVWNLGYDRKSALALDHRHDGLFVVRTDDGVAFPMTYLLARFNVRRSFAQRATPWDLSSALVAAGVALSLLLLAAKVLPQAATLGLCLHTHANKAFHGSQAACPLFAQDSIAV